MSTYLMPVPFEGDTVVLIGQDNQPYVAMKPIVTNMGLDWKNQHVKLAQRFAATVVEITTVAEDGKMREMACLPLRKLPAWLYTISPNKVAPALREKVERYQERCDDALWDYWAKGPPSRIGHRFTAQEVVLSNHRLALLKTLYRTRNSAMRTAIHEQLAQVSIALGLSTPALDDIGMAEPSVNEALEAFWSAIWALEAEGIRCNHSKNAALIALNLPEIKEVFADRGIEILVDRELTMNLKGCRSPRFQGYKAVDSRFRNSTVKCWVFHQIVREGSV
jgi:hypothetical protein